MKKLLLISSAAFLTLGAAAQQLGADYITWPSSGSLPDYITNWNNGSATIEGWEDENFFISRVKPKTHIRNAATQIYGDITEATDKRLIWWVPCGNSDLKGVHTDALPNGIMDSEVFSMWQYVTHYGDWIAPFGWVPASLADVAHKNGTAVSGVASIPYGSLTSDWRTTLVAMNGLSAEQIGKFLIYHGVDGLGYNSEFSGFGVVNIKKTYTLLQDLVTYMSTRNPIFENIWYAGTMDNGNIGFDKGLGSYNYQFYKGASYFLNYNWNNASTMQSSISYSENTVNKDPLYLYAGINMQGGEPASNNWPLLKQYRYSIGLWGAHQVNMLWQSRNSNGSSTEAMQRTYLKSCEQWFGNGLRNPAMRQEIKSYSSYGPHDNFHGMSSMMTARSTLSWDLSAEPFYSYFNLGNGAFFNWKGERAMTGEWYNIGIQDYLPTWRFWFAPSFLNNDVAVGQVNLKAEFTWDDAYFGGSCLNISGTTNNEYLHLFKTDFNVAAGDIITVRYKLLSGQGDVRLVFSHVGSESSVISNSRYNVLTVANTAEALKQSHAAGTDGWVTMRVPVVAAEAGRMAVIALQFQNAQNLNILLGEMSITKPTAMVTPDAPVVDASRLFCNNMKGIDGKIIFHMPGEKAKPEPTYNADVNTAMFRLWAQEEDGEPQFMGATTSWAGLMFRAQSSADDSRRFRLGVSAVSMDMNTESAIAWGSWLTKPTYVQNDDFAIDKTIIKPNQTFSIAYVDARHTPSTWDLYNQAGTKLAHGSGVSFTVEGGLPEIGGYDLVVDEGSTNERRINYYVQITGDKVGAYPEIATLTIGDEEATAPVEIDLTDNLTIGYTGNPTNGDASRGLALNEKMVGAYNNQVGIQAGKSFSVCAWICLDEMPNATWDLFNICNRNDSWPMNNWGWCWVRPGTDGKFNIKFRNQNNAGNSQEMHYTIPGACIQAKVWTHLAFIFEYGSNGEGFRAQLYINGIKQESTWIAHQSGNSGGGRGTGSTDDFCATQNLGIATGDMILFGGTPYQGAAANGVVDDFQIWKKAMTADDVKAAMAGFTSDEIPAELVGLWSFEDEPDADGNFFSAGSDKTIPAYHFSYEATPDASEGQSGRKIEQPSFVGGSPFLAGTAFPVRATPSWSASHYATVINGTGTDTAGSASVKFGEEGDHTITLTLSNVWGSDSRQYPVFTANDKETAIDALTDAAEHVYTVGDMLFVEFAESGNWSVTVTDTKGATLAHKSATVNGGNMMRIKLPTAGIYVISIAKDGNRTRTLKVARN